LKNNWKRSCKNAKEAKMKAKSSKIHRTQAQKSIAFLPKGSKKDFCISTSEKAVAGQRKPSIPMEMLDKIFPSLSKFGDMHVNLLSLTSMIRVTALASLVRTRAILLSNLIMSRLHCVRILQLLNVLIRM
jgi:hypothetical protein